MIARINGLLISKSVSNLIVDINGLGYRVFVPLTTFYELPDEGQKVALHIHTHVKDDAIHLFGFYRYADKLVFQLMISVSGIGPKLAINILSGITAEELIHAVSNGDLDRLVRIPGVGKKMAERMILELRDKLLKLELFAKSADEHVGHVETDANREDALSALINLGYKGQAATSALEKSISGCTEPLSLEELLKKTLKILAG